MVLSKKGNFYPLKKSLRHLSIIMLLMTAIMASAQRQSLEEWEKKTFLKQPPEKVMDTAGIKPGMVIGEVGAGRGRFTMHLARRVGPKGKIFANDIDADALAYLRERCKRAGITNVETILGEEIDPLFPKKSLDMIFMVWTYHYVAQPLPLLKNLPKSLKPGGTVVLVEPKPGLVYEGQDHGISPERMRRDAEQAGFKLVRTEKYLEEDFIFILHLSVQPVTFTQSPQIFPPADTNHVGLGDFDGDGDLDAVFTNQAEHHSQILINNGKGYFTDSGQKLTPQGHGAGIGDLDNDGDLDLFITCAGWTDKDRISHKRPSKVYLNDGLGHFIDSGLDLGDTDSSGNGINLIDIDADGDLDAHIYYYTVTENPFYHLIYINDGKGRFKTSDIILPKGSLLFWGDLDKDGFVDVFLMEWEKGLRALKNDGKGKFSECWQLPDTDILYGDAALGDLDKDGDLDVIVGNREGTSEKPTYVYLNDGTGRFKNSGQILNPTKNPDLCLADLNGDGFLDVYISNFRAPNEVWLNNRKGQFIDTGLRMCGDDPTAKISIGDLDGDGDPDVFVSFYGDGSNSIWLNDRN